MTVIQRDNASPFDPKVVCDLVLQENKVGITLYQDNFLRMQYSFDRFYAVIQDVIPFPREISQLVHDFGNWITWEEYINSCNGCGENALLIAVTKVRKMVPYLLGVGANPLAWVYDFQCQDYVTVLDAVKPSEPNVAPFADPSTLTTLERAAKNSSILLKPKVAPVSVKKKKQVRFRSASFPMKTSAAKFIGTFVKIFSLDT